MSVEVEFAHRPTLEEKLDAAPKGAHFLMKLTDQVPKCRAHCLRLTKSIDEDSYTIRTSSVNLGHSVFLSGHLRNKIHLIQPQFAFQAIYSNKAFSYIAKTRRDEPQWKRRLGSFPRSGQILQFADEKIRDFNNFESIKKSYPTGFLGLLPTGRRRSKFLILFFKYFASFV